MTNHAPSPLWTRVIVSIWCLCQIVRIFGMKIFWLRSSLAWSRHWYPGSTLLIHHIMMIIFHEIMKIIIHDIMMIILSYITKIIIHYIMIIRTCFCVILSSWITSMTWLRFNNKKSPIVIENSERWNVILALLQVFSFS